jgi:hypothetical protein
MFHLPTELLFHIIECLIPSSPPLGFPASHVVTRTLLKLCLVCKTIHYAAIRCLFAHCVYIDSPDRLKLLQQTLIDHQQGRAFGSSTHHQSPVDKDYPHFDLHARWESRPISFIKSLFLAPFPDDTIDCPEIAPLILGLCTTLSSYLTRLVIDIPLRSLYPEDDTNHVRPFLQAAFQELVVLEEFVSTRDELFLDVTEHDWNNPDVAIWSTWPNLRRLALYNVDVSADSFIQDIQQCRNLTHLVLTRTDGLTERTRSLTPHMTLQISPHLQRVLIVNTASEHRIRPAFSRRKWKQCFVGKVWAALSDRTGYGAQIVKVDVAVPVGREDDVIELCQEWVCEAAIQGTLWESKDAPLLVKSNSKELGGLKIGWQMPHSSSPDLTPNYRSESD